jgi:TetR/AcrR family transcriptional regulator, cholesterol catabolism regulator
MAKIPTSKNGTKKEMIIQKAALLFKSKSYTAASMRELAEALGVEAPSLYNHIGSKSELLQAICFKVGNKFTIQIEITKNSSASIITKLEAVIRFHIQMMLENFDEVYVANHEWKHLQEPYLNDFLNIRRNYEKSLAMLIELGIEQNEIKKTNPYLAVLTILSAVRGLEFWQRNKKNVSPQVLEDDMVNHLLNGISSGNGQ